jgi:hypothetical protein
MMSEIKNQLITAEVEIKFKFSEKIIVPAKR